MTDGTIQKVKQQYNQSGGPALEVTLAEIQEDLKLRPPQVIDLDEVQLSNGIGNGHVEQGPGSGKTFDHMTYYIILTMPAGHWSILLCFMYLWHSSNWCMLLRSSECSTGTSDGTRNPLIGPEYHVCIFEHDPWRSPHRVHVTGTFLYQMLYKNMYC